MATLDGSIVNISLPVMSKYFNVSINSVQWVVTAYLLTISAILLIWGKLSDIYGRKYLFAAGMLIFTIGSALCGISNSLELLIISRVIQAIGASITMALVQGIVTSIFPANERGKALGVIGATVAIGSLLGPGLGGILVRFAGWQSIFYINIPIGIAGFVLTLILMTETEMKTANKAFDIKGSLIFVVSITTMFTSLLSYQDKLISSTIMILMVFIAIILFAIFIRYEKGLSNPLLDTTIFSNRKFSMSLATSYISFLSMFAYIFFMPFYLQYAMKLNILTAGLLMSIYPVVTAILAPISGWLSDKKLRISLTFLGLSINTLALALLSFLNSTSSLIHTGLLIMMLGAGSALFQSPNTSTIMGSVSRDKVGVAGSINAFFRNFGMVSGTTLSVILFMYITKMDINNLSGSSFDIPLFLKGFRAVLLNASGLSLIAVGINVLIRKNQVNSINHAKETK